MSTNPRAELWVLSLAAARLPPPKRHDCIYVLHLQSVPLCTHDRTFPHPLPPPHAPHLYNVPPADLQVQQLQESGNAVQQHIRAAANMSCHADPDFQVSKRHKPHRLEQPEGMTGGEHEPAPVAKMNMLFPSGRGSLIILALHRVASELLSNW